MIIADLSMTSRAARYPARRRTQNLVGGASPIQATNFSLGHVTLEPNGGQVPWHNQEQEEIYFVHRRHGRDVSGRRADAVSTRAGRVHSLAGISPAHKYGLHATEMIYCYGPAGDVAHWRQELEGTLHEPGWTRPPLPDGARRNAHRQPTGDENP